jgi:hypothetical protein
MKIEFSREIFEKYSNIVKMLPVGAELFHADDRRTDRHEEAKSRFSQFWE